ncbi:DUF732 domain-containing protein [Tomitella biformata]|uniref:DUF732 domain-containing protein n=1 Tax=Tomitella biformata TaxID=630403 RepID=UPI0004664CDC|nr:DUF732 domain-containing protein [Tomitella biformata]
MRTAFGRGLVAAALAVGVAGLTAACGGDGSTVSSTPSVSASQSAGSSPTTPSSTVDPSPTAVPPTAPAEAPEPVPEGYPGPAAPERSTRDQAFLDGLGEKGIDYSQGGDVALSAAQYICASEADAVPQVQMRQYVLAFVASDAQLLNKEIDAEAVTDAYIATAQATFCNA